MNNSDSIEDNTVSSTTSTFDERSSRGERRRELSGEPSRSSDADRSNVSPQECVVISDDDCESPETARYQSSSKRPRRSDNVVMITDKDNVVMVTDEDQPGPSNRGTDNVVMVTRPPNPIPVPDDDEPIITNVIDGEERSPPITWQFVQRSTTAATDSVGVRRNAHPVSRYRARRPTARRAIRSREYGQFLNVVRDLTNDGVVVSPLTRSSEHSNSRRLRSHSRHLDIESGRNYSPDRIASREIMTPAHRLSMEENSSATIPPRRGAVAHEELLHMTSLRDRITTLRRDLQNLNGILTDSFELLHRIAPTPNPPLVDKSVLDRAPTKVASEAEVSREKKCSICLGQYNLGETLRVLPCDHEFHESCIDRWLTTCSRKCPFCRTDIQEALT